MVVEIIHRMYCDTSDSWAVEYPDEANHFFTKPYPQIAIDTLGYPPEPSYLMHSPEPRDGEVDTGATSISWDYEPDQDSTPLQLPRTEALEGDT